MASPQGQKQLGMEEACPRALATWHFPRLPPNTPDVRAHSHRKTHELLLISFDMCRQLSCASE
eukprot:4650655-Amphidinium_carterae.1